MRVPTHHGRTTSDVAMTPMIDVVFQLLIFFICTASFQQAEMLLPMGLAEASATAADAQSSQAPQPEPRRVVVAMSHDGSKTQWTVDERPVRSLADLQLALQAQAELDRAAPVTFDVAGGVPLGDMIDVYDLCRLAGLARIEFAVGAR